MAIANVTLPPSGYNGKGLPPLAKNALVIGGVVVGMAIIGFGGWKIYKYLSEARTRKQTGQEGKDAKADLRDLQALGQKASFMDSQYSQWANQLKEAFDGCGTSNGQWRSIFGQLKNDIDVLKLNTAYGTRTFDSCNWEFSFGDFEGTLSQALTHELSSSEMEELNGMLEKQSIKFRY